MLTKRQKENAVKPVKRHETDSGSPEAQIAILTRRINELAAHLRKNKKDFHSRRGLLQLVADRRKHLKYLARKNESAYRNVLSQLSLKR